MKDVRKEKGGRMEKWWGRGGEVESFMCGKNVDNFMDFILIF